MDGSTRTGGGRREARTLMIQGTASHVGKSWIVAGLCRVLRQDGWRVAPFKGQNMSLNAAVVPGGGEIGRAQALQALAAGIPLATDLNPVLLKPSGDLVSQIVLNGRPAGAYRAAEGYGELAGRAWEAVTAALARLRAAHDVVVIEGAGSPAEVNLRARDMANMRVAAAADAPVLLVADVDRGGALAAVVGTLELLPPVDRARVRGVVINRFRGERSLLQGGLDFLAAHTGVPVLGVLPWLDLPLDEEDGVALDHGARPGDARADIEVAVVHLPRISNFTDLAAVAASPGVRVTFARTPDAARGADALVLPGSKATVADLAWLRAAGWGEAVARAPLVVGLCGGLQMLGRAVRDPLGVEGPPGNATGLGLLDAETTLRPEKRTVLTRARVRAGAPGFLADLAGTEVEGYEIHAGETAIGPGSIQFLDGCTGAASRDGRAVGTYLHGFFDPPHVRAAFVNHLRRHRGLTPLPAEAFPPPQETAEAALDTLAAAVRTHLDMAAVYRLAGLGAGPRAGG